MTTDKIKLILGESLFYFWANNSKERIESAKELLKREISLGLRNSSKDNIELIYLEYLLS